MELVSKSRKQSLIFDESSLHFSVRTDGDVWTWASGYRPRLVLDGTDIYFEDAGTTEHTIERNGVGTGIRSRYAGFSVNGRPAAAVFETFVWIEESTGDVFFEWIPLEDGGAISRVYWPGPMAFEQGRRDWYTLLTQRQGMLIPNDWETPVTKLCFDGMFLTAGAYMPWFSQIRAGSGYIAVALTPWNGSVAVDHPSGGPYTHVSVTWEPSLGRMDYRRCLRYSFRGQCDYNDMCKIYRRYVFENGLAATLAEKAVRLPAVNDLIGAAFVHKGIKTSVNPASDFFDPDAPDKNNSLTTFVQRAADLEAYHRLGVKKLFLHLDGWAQPGYDNQHPDYLPACGEAGGWSGMQELADTAHRLGSLLCVHDQYRDYYKDAPSYSDDYACRLPDGTIPQHARWAGGPQAYLCASQVPYFVRRNYREIREHGVRLDAAYLDVFTCNEGDECANPRHVTTRRSCYEYRGRCFDYLTAEGILPGSEEVSDWAMRSLVFCHYAPYEFMMDAPGSARTGIGVPLFNLVYHDCVIIPWMMERVGEHEDYMLYALLNGGAPYFERAAAYPNIDGAFEDRYPFTAQERVQRCVVVTALQEKVAMQEMLRHTFVGGDPQVQQTVFADGTTVTIDLNTGSYVIEISSHKTDNSRSSAEMREL